MKKNFQTVLASLTLMYSFNAKAVEATFNPNTQFYDVNGNGILSLWGIPGTSGAVKANPDYGYPTEAAIASWTAMLMKAQELNLVVVVGYDPSTLDIWYVAKPR